MLTPSAANIFITSRVYDAHAMTRICLHAPRLLRFLSSPRVMSTESSLPIEHDHGSPELETLSLSREPVEGESLVYAALRILYEPNAARKGVLTHQTANLWRAGKLTLQGDTFQDMPPVLSRPARDDTVTFQSPACPVSQETLTMYLIRPASILTSGGGSVRKP